MHTDSTPPIDPEMDPEMDPETDPPIDPRLRVALQQLQLEPGPIVPEQTSQEIAAQAAPDWKTFAARVVDAATKPAHERLMQERRTHERLVSGTDRVRKNVTARGVWVGIAVAVLCAIGLTTTRMYQSASQAPATHAQQYQTAGGQVSRVTLSDGTVLTLAPATSVAVSGTKDGATVDVEGEAYFTVAQSSTHPFVVRTSNTVVHVLGTAFSVRRYANETRTRVVVEDGKVAVRAKRHEDGNDVPTTMTARMMAQVSDSGVSVTPVSDTRTLTGWRDGMLVFTDAPVRDVVAEIARCYNAVIRIEGKELADETMVLKVSVRQQSLSQVLNLVGFAINAHVRRDGDAYVLVPGRNVTAPKVREQQVLPQPEKLYGR